MTSYTIVSLEPISSLSNSKANMLSRLTIMAREADFPHTSLRLASCVVIKGSRVLRV
jgi:hypothetical protein